MCWSREIRKAIFVVFEKSVGWLVRRLAGYRSELWVPRAVECESCRMAETRRLLSPKTRMALFHAYLCEAYYSGVLMPEK